MSEDIVQAANLSDISIGMMERFAASGDVLSALSWCLPKILDTLKAEAGSLFLINKNQDELSCSVCIGPVDITGIKVSVTAGLVGKAFIDRNGSLITDAQSNNSHNHAIDEKFGFVTKSILTVPVIFRDRCFGCLQAINLMGDDKEIKAFSEDHLIVFNKLASILGVALQNVDYANELIRDALIKKDLQSAEETQRHLFPLLSSYDSVVGQVIPARNLSGDFVDYFTVRDEIYFCQGDVAGKGIPAALTVARCLAFFRHFAKQSMSPRDIVALMNAELLEMSERSEKSAGFVTFFIGKYSEQTGSVVYVNCGHGDVVVLDTNNVMEIISSNLPPLGIVETDTLNIEEGLVNIQGRKIYIFTDGILEANSASKELGIAGVTSLCKAVNQIPSRQALAKIMDLFLSEKLTTTDDATFMIVG
jgi:sigma-B regulation protein RsbU (phosphoserine phosphatase)